MKMKNLYKTIVFIGFGLLSISCIKTVSGQEVSNTMPDLITEENTVLQPKIREFRIEHKKPKPKGLSVGKNYTIIPKIGKDDLRDDQGIQIKIQISHPI
jgi:ribosomal protein L5